MSAAGLRLDRAASAVAPSAPILLALVGSSIQASRTPRMHEAEAAAQGLRCIYRIVDLETTRFGPGDLADILRFAEGFGFSGLNVTHPCKQAALPLLDELTEDARRIGAVNTVLFRSGRAIGHNTDWWGFASSFERELGAERRRDVVLFGAGGGGAAVAHALMTLGVERLSIVDADPARASQLAAHLCAGFGDRRAGAAADIAEALGAADGVVNATPLGMARYPGMALGPALLRPSFWVADIVYFPLETELLRQARARGCRVMSGAGMAVFQAARAFELFTGRCADVDRMAAAFAAMGEDAG